MNLNNFTSQIKRQVKWLAIQSWQKNLTTLRLGSDSLEWIEIHHNESGFEMRFTSKIDTH